MTRAVVGVLRILHMESIHKDGALLRMFHMVFLRESWLPFLCRSNNPFVFKHAGLWIVATDMWKIVDASSIPNRRL